MNNHPKVCATATVYVMSYYFVCSARFVALLKLLLLEGQKRLYFSLDSRLYNLSFDSTSNTTPFNVRWPGNHSHARTIRALVKRFLVLLK